MKTCFAFFAATLLSASPLVAQDLVSSGTITSVSKDGTLALVPESRTGNPLVFHNIYSVRVYYAGGGLAPLTELHAGQPASIHYQQVGKQIVVAKITVPNPPPYTLPVVPIPPLGLPAAERRILGAKVLHDRDITTQPGSKASIDNDITTQPGRNR